MNQPTWRASSHCNGGSCVEVAALPWYKGDHAYIPYIRATPGGRTTTINTTTTLTSDVITKAAWRKSTQSGSAGHCVEIAPIQRGGGKGGGQ